MCRSNHFIGSFYHEVGFTIILIPIILASSLGFTSFFFFFFTLYSKNLLSIRKSLLPDTTHVQN